MYSWKIAKSLDHLNASSWEELVKGDPALSHNERIYSYCLAREALRLSFLELGIIFGPQELKVEHYSSLNKAPHYTLSLSHTKKWGAAIVAPKNEFLSVGIDIEENERDVKASIIQKVSHPLDEKLRNLDLWCLKEAAFKCLMNSKKFTHPIPFSQIEVSKEKWRHSPSGSEGELNIMILPELTVAKAFWKN